MFEGNKILILGFARSGYEAAKLLINRGNEVILNDNKEEDKQDLDKVKELKDLGVKFVFGSHPDDLLDTSFDYLIKNPGVPIDHKYVLKCKELGVEKCYVNSYDWRRKFYNASGFITEDTIGFYHKKI